MRILTAAQMQAVDAATIAGTPGHAAIPGLALMEAAGSAVAAYLFRRFPDAAAGPVAVLCGKGNNGGDGMAAARLLRQRGVPVRLILLADPSSLRGDAATQWATLQDPGAENPVEIAIAADAPGWELARAHLSGARVWVDAILGTGLASPPRAFVAQVIRDLNAARPRPPVLAVDLPSGLAADGEWASSEDGWDGSAVVQATATVTFTAPKLGAISGEGVAFCGDLHMAEIGSAEEVVEQAAPQAPARPEDGLPLSAWLTTAEDCLPFLTPRASAGHKGRYGHVVVLGGSEGKAGAAAMAAEAALRIGAGLVTATVPRSILPTVAAHRAEVMTAPLAETADGGIAPSLLDPGAWEAWLTGKTLAAIGPGLTARPEVAETVRRVILRLPLPWVLDADGLNAFAGRAAGLRQAPAPGVLTPHPGEMGRLLGISAAEVQRRRIGSARRLAAAANKIVALKGFRTVIAEPGGRIFINPTGNPGMATGGTGDILTGIIAGLWAQHAQADPLRVVAAAVYLHGKAADLAVAETGEMSLCATDITRCLPAALRWVRHAASGGGNGRDLPAELR